MHSRMYSQHCAMSSAYLVVLLAVLLNFVVIHAQRSCPSGEFFANGKCELCPPGTHREKRFFNPTKRCIKCPPGTFNPNRGAIGKELCRACYPDTFSAAGATECTACPPGTVANRAASVCLKCGPGMRASALNFDLKNPSKCLPCERNTYNSKQASRNCTMCPSGMTSPKGASSAAQCTPCPPGKEAYEGSRGCEPCTSGRFKSENMTTCKRCPPGTIPEAMEGATSCTPCPKGSKPNGSFAETCRPCQPGFVTFGEGARVCRRPGFPCPRHFFESRTGDCDRCEGGQRLNVDKKVCEECPPGTISQGGSREKCKKCPPGQRPNEDQDGCKCKEGETFGKDGKCVKCKPGTFLNDNYIGFDECPECDPGSFADKPGSLTCRRCPIGMVGERPRGSTKCVTCPEGQMPNIPMFDSLEEGTACVSVQTGCPSGWASKTTGATTGPIFGCRRISCPVGTPPQDIGKTCLPCEPGEVLDEAGIRCRRCPRDEVSDGGIITKCQKCKNGLKQDLNDPSKCSCFLVGFGVQDGVCKRCPKGSTAVNSEVCTPCKPGTFARSKHGCERCSGTVSTNPGATRCQKCPDGTIPNRFLGGTECIGMGK